MTYRAPQIARTPYAMIWTTMLLVSAAFGRRLNVRGAQSTPQNGYRQKAGKAPLIDRAENSGRVALASGWELTRRAVQGGGEILSGRYSAEPNCLRSSGPSFRTTAPVP